MQVTIPVAVRVLADLDRERTLMGDASLDETIVRRIGVGIATLGVALDFAMDWREPPSMGVMIALQIPGHLKYSLDEVCEFTGKSLEAVLVTFISSRNCKPKELAYIDALASAWSPPNKLERYSHTDADRGPVYLTTVEMPGYWIEFFSLVGDRRLSLNSVLQLAIQALAREIAESREVIGVRAGKEALSLARRIAADAEFSA